MRGLVASTLGFEPREYVTIDGQGDGVFGLRYHGLGRLSRTPHPSVERRGPMPLASSISASVIFLTFDPSLFVCRRGGYRNCCQSRW